MQRKKITGDALHKRQISELKLNGNQSVPVIICAGVNVPENIGSIFRIADAAGCRKIIFVDDENELDLKNNKIKKVSRDTAKNIEVDVVDFETLKLNKSELAPLVAVEITSDSKNILDVTLSSKISLVIGSESRGIPDNVLQLCDECVHIPMHGINGSMNVSHALAIAMYEWHRQNTR